MCGRGRGWASRTGCRTTPTTKFGQFRPEPGGEGAHTYLRARVLASNFPRKTPRKDPRAIYMHGRTCVCACVRGMADSMHSNYGVFTFERVCYLTLPPALIVWQPRKTNMPLKRRPDTRARPDNCVALRAWNGGPIIMAASTREPGTGRSLGKSTAIGRRIVQVHPVRRPGTNCERTATTTPVNCMRG